MFRKIRTFAWTLALVVSAGAQQDRSAITGIVKDSTRSIIRGAKVYVTHAETGSSYATTSNDTGQFTVPDLPVGNYRLAFEAPGFKRLVRDGVHIDVGQAARVEAQLEPGDVKESVRVTAEAPRLDTQGSEIGALLENRRVADFPLTFAGGRSPEMFAYKLAPGVEGDNWTSHVNGGPAFSKDVLLDGASITTYIAGHFGESSVSMEGIEEFRIETSGMSAEYGRTYGGIFNFVMKSGSNQLHGSALGQLRNEWMDANSFLSNAYGQPKQRDRRHDYALSLGGPLAFPRPASGNHKAFFYLAYEKYAEQNAGVGSPRVTVPLPEWWSGDLSRYLTGEALGKDALGRDVYRGALYDPASTRLVNGNILRDIFPGNLIPRARISPVAERLGQVMTQDYAPQVRQADGQFAMVNNSFFPAANVARFDQTQLSFKLDGNLSSRQKLSGLWAYVDRPRLLLDQGGVWNASLTDGGPLSRARMQDVQSAMARVSHDYTLRDNLLNHAIAAFNRQINPSQSTHIGQDGAALLGISGLAAQGNFPEIVFSGGDRVSLPTLGYTANNMLAATSYEIADTLSWIRGRHTLRFGADLRRNLLNDRNASGPATFVFSSTITGLPGFNKTGSPFASMLLGQVSSASAPVDTPTGSRFQYESLFAQDDFRASSHLTLQWGLRWEYQPVQTEAYNRLSSFCTTCVDPQSGIAGSMQYAGNGRSGFVRNRWNNFGPRLGLAFQMRPSIAFRAAYGILYEARVPNDWSGVPYGQKMGFTKQNAVNDPGKGQAAFAWDQGYPGVVSAAKPDASLAGSVYGPVYWDPQGGKAPSIQQWNAGFQLALPWNLVADLNYLGNKATGLYANALENINQIPTAALSLGDVLGTYVDSEAAIPAAAKALGARYPYREPGTWVPVQQTLQPFPQVPYWNPILAYNAPLGFSTYHAFQASVNRRFASGLTWLANYTFSKALSNLDSAFNTYSNYGRPLDYYNLWLEKSISSFDQTHSVKFGLRYDLPFGRGNIRGGWTVQALGQYASGFPLSFAGTPAPNTNLAANRAAIVNPGGTSLSAGFQSDGFDASGLSTPGAAANRYVNISLVQDPARYTLGNASFATSQIRSPGFRNEDLGIQKAFSIRERLRVQLRLEFLNVLNRHRFGGIDTNAASPLFGQVTGIDAGFYRQTQAGMRLDF